VYSDDKGELRVEKIDGKKVLTAKDPKGLLLFSGPVETKEDLDKAPAEVRQRYEKLQTTDLPAVISAHDSGTDIEIDDDSGDDGDNDPDIQSMNQISGKPSGKRSNSLVIRLGGREPPPGALTGPPTPLGGVFLANLERPALLKLAPPRTTRLRWKRQPVVSTGRVAQTLRVAALIAHRVFV